MLNEIMRENADIFASEVFQTFSVYSEEIINFIVQQEGGTGPLDEMECAIENWDTIIYLSIIYFNHYILNPIFVCLYLINGKVNPKLII